MTSRQQLAPSYSAFNPLFKRIIVDLSLAVGKNTKCMPDGLRIFNGGCCFSDCPEVGFVQSSCGAQLCGRQTRPNESLSEQGQITLSSHSLELVLWSCIRRVVMPQIQRLNHASKAMLNCIFRMLECLFGFLFHIQQPLLHTLHVATRRRA